MEAEFPVVVGEVASRSWSRVAAVEEEGAEAFESWWYPGFEVQEIVLDRD